MTDTLTDASAVVDTAPYSRSKQQRLSRAARVKRAKQHDKETIDGLLVENEALRAQLEEKDAKIAEREHLLRQQRQIIAQQRDKIEEYKLKLNVSRMTTGSL